MVEAQFYKTIPQGVQCLLCPHQCVIKMGSTGKCGVRMNLNDRLYCKSYGRVSHLEKVKSSSIFYSFHKDQDILAVGSLGCNSRCLYCKNCTVSRPDDTVEYDSYSPQDIIDKALHEQCRGICFTYNEPTVNFEFVVDVFRIAKQRQLFTMIVSNGFINKEPLQIMLSLTDAFLIDVKAFDDLFYRTNTESFLAPVLSTLKNCSAANAYLELTYLVIPGLNDSIVEFEKMCHWVSSTIGEKTVNLPVFKAVKNRPIQGMDKDKLLVYKEMAQKYHLNAVIRDNE